MSEWNNSYAYNNQYNQNSSWNGDRNGQYVNQQYYPSSQYNPNNQYVNFNEFINQMQNNGALPSNPANYNNVNYQNYPASQYSYQNTASSSGTQQDSQSYPSNAQNVSNGEESYQTDDPTTPHASSLTTSAKPYTNEMVLKSNLTPTATEFVPKSSAAPAIQASTSAQETSPPEQVTRYPNDSRSSSSSTNNHYSKSSDTNWRERPHSSQPNERKSSAFNENNFKINDVRKNDNFRKQDSNRHVRDKDTSNQHYNYNRGSHEYHGRNYKGNNESNNKTSDTKAYRDPNKQYDSSRNQDYNNQDYETNDEQNYASSSCNNDRGQSKSNYKSKGKDTATFYNSSINKHSQDSRLGRGESFGRGKNWNGSQRLRGAERNSNEDEQYAKSYINHNEERYEKPRKESVASPHRKSKHFSGDQTASSEMTQRERLSEQLDKGTLECLVCCERVKQIDSVWACANCYHVFHLRCIRKWGMSSFVEGKWRCPACQNTSSEIPTEYRCMCGAVRSPEYQRGSNGAHTCGKSCARPRSCPHPCTLLCHPGPCPPCQATINKQCGCGAETRSVLCSSKLPQVCGRVCHRTLECDVHTCTKDCHERPCDSCTETVTQVCHCCAGASRTVACTRESGRTARWACGAACSRVLACGAHVCRDLCHAPPCPPCALLPDRVVACPCGKNKLDKDKRKSCTDPIPLCGNICAKPLPCGPAGDKHFCKIDCHEGPCPECPDMTLLQCRCGHSSREVPCTELPEMINNVVCQKKCNKKLSCGRHRCRAACCACDSHRCGVVCGRSLSCQLHRCTQLCHTGHCAPCPILSWEEVRCACGGTVSLPPVRCGARPPACTLPCAVPQPCGHPALHACHAPPCPPCVVLTARHCHGGHEERKTIPCSQGEFSCGLPCGKPLPCGKHTCIKICHKGPCDTEKCTQPCRQRRARCGHECAAPCHAAGGGACPAVLPCRRPVRATCLCGRRDALRVCHENAHKARMLSAALAATKIQEGESVDLSEAAQPANMLKTLECDDSCRVEARTRQMALALQIRNPDVSAKLAPRYSEHCRATAGKDPALAAQVHDTLTQLVQLAKKSKQKTRSHSFPSMNRQKRQFIHEMCEHFGCESVAYDAEPNRNVVATADREKSWLPAMSLMEVVGGRRRIPPPALRCPAPTTTNNNKSSSGWATLTSTNAWAARPQPQKQPEPPKIDYFDNPPDN